jgi:hypothetical protein
VHYVLEVARSGSCEPHYRFGVQIINGHVVYKGKTTGRVWPNGSVPLAIALAHRA